MTALNPTGDMSGRLTEAPEDAARLIDIPLGNGLQEYHWDEHSQRRPAFVKRCANGADRAYDPLPEIRKQLEIMLASAVTHGNEYITGYTIKTGALHKILAAMMCAGFPVTVRPSRAALNESNET